MFFFYSMLSYPWDIKSNKETNCAGERLTVDFKEIIILYASGETHNSEEGKGTQQTTILKKRGGGGGLERENWTGVTSPRIEKGDSTMTT